MAKKDLIGQKVVEVRKLTAQEMEDEGWSSYNNPTVIVFEDGTKIYPSRDGEGNGPGVMFGKRDEQSLYI